MLSHTYPLLSIEHFSIQRITYQTKIIRIRSAFDVLSKTSPDGFIIRKIPIDNHQLPLKIRQLPVASSRFFRFSIFFFLILAFSDLFYYLLILYTKHKFLFCLDPMLPLFSLLIVIIQEVMFHTTLFISNDRTQIDILHTLEIFASTNGFVSFS